MRPLRSLAVGLLLAGSTVAAPVTGTVFLDRNGDGQRQEGEPPVAGAMVSDEAAIVTTAADGMFTIEPAAGSEVLFIVNPAGTWPSSPWHVWLAAAQSPVDFALRPMEQPEPVTFVQGTDLHVHPVAAVQYEQYIAHVNASPYHPAFVVHTGDLVRDSNRATLDEATRLFDLYDQGAAKLAMPVREVMGNHEVFGQTHPDVDPATPGYGKSLYRRRYGPATYAFRYGRYHFLALDCTITLPGKVTYGLTDESLAWASAYLAHLGDEEPVVLLVHEPLSGHPNERQLSEVLAGKQLVATLCGHGHSRSIGRWTGAPQVMGGAVSYAWHGYLPFPPQPWGYVVWRLDHDQAEWSFADWAEERSVDVVQPAFARPLTGPAPLLATVNDPSGDIASASATLGGKTVDVAVSRPATLATQLTGLIDPAGLTDGVYELKLSATAGDQTFTHDLPLVVLTGQQPPFQAAGDAKLTLIVTGISSPGNRILLNGEPLADVPAGDARWVAEIALPAVRLQRLNAVTLLAGGTDKLFLAAVAIEYGGRKYGDVRVPRTRPDPVVTDADGKLSRTAYVDLTYDGPRGTMP